MFPNELASREATDAPSEPALTTEDEQSLTQDLLQDLRSSTSKDDITGDQLSLTKKLLNWRTIVPLVVVIALLVWLIIQAKIDPIKIWETMQKANLWLFALGFLTYYVALAIRSMRWKMLLENVGFTKKNGIVLPSFSKTYEIVLASFFANSIVPAKLGDVYRAYLLKKEIHVSTTRSFATVLAERLLDMMMLLVLLIPAFMISLRDRMPQQIMIALVVLLVAVIVGIIGLFVLRMLRHPLERFVPVKFRKQYHHFHEGTLGSFKRIPTLGLMTVGIWACEVLRFYLVASSLSLFTGSALHILAAATVSGLVMALLTAVPATGGGLGVVEGGMLGVISLFVQGAEALTLIGAVILLDRLISYFSVLIIGFFAYLWAFSRANKASSVPEQAQEASVQP